MRKKRKIHFTNYHFSVSKDRAHQDEKVVRRQANIQELVTLKDSDRRLRHELEKTKELLRNEQLKYREATQKVDIKQKSQLKITAGQWTITSLFDRSHFYLLKKCITALFQFLFLQLTREEQTAIQGV